MNSRTLLLWLIPLWIAGAFASSAPDKLIAHKEAGSRLVGLIESAQASHQPSLLKTPEAMSLVKQISNEKEILRSDPYTPAELGTLLDICDVANKASVSLMLFDLKTVLSRKSPQQQAQAEMIALGNSNTVLFQDELKELQPFLIRCLAKEVPPMTQFVASLKPAEFTDIRRQGLTGSRTGLLQIYSAGLQAATDTRYRDDYRLAFLAALAETSPTFVTVMQLPVRRQLRDSLAMAASKATGPYKFHLTRIVSALSNDICAGLCAIP